MVELTRTGHLFEPDLSRVLARPFVPGQPAFGGETSRIDQIIDRLRALDDVEVAEQIEAVRERSTPRHRDIAELWERHAAIARDLSRDGCSDFDADRMLLLGMTFTLEYTFEAASLCNPSMVPWGTPAADGSQSFVMSCRAIGEGHISSITFRSGRVTAGGRVEFEPARVHADNGTRRPAQFNREHFRLRLTELGALNQISELILGDLSPSFGLDELEVALANSAERDVAGALSFETERAIHWLATSSYEVEFGSIPLEERVLSPAGPAESRGMEDARFVRFVDDDGTVTYYATYTAFDGFEVLPQLIETPDFRRFRISTLGGICARGKGMALFPRRVGGDYVALARTDNESTFVLRSDDVRRWDVSELVVTPSEPWEVVQAGNCGSPIETPAGWLVLMHGVGPMRRYVLSALLLDLDEPAKLIGRLRRPLLEPDESESNGYVPNVVYSCGGMTYGDTLIVPYGISDSRISVGTVEVSELLDAMD